MTGFGTNNEHNIGGGLTIYFRPNVDLESIPEAVNKLISDDIVFVTGVTGFYEGYSTLDKLNFVEEELPNDGGTSSFRYSISGFFPSSHPDYDDNFEQISQYRHVVLCEDNSGRQRLVGNTEKGMRFRATWSSGEKAGDLKGYKYEFAGEFDERQPFYGSVPEIEDLCEAATIVLVNSAAEQIDTFTAVGGVEIEREIDDVEWTDSDESPQTTPYGQPIVCTPVSVHEISVSLSDTTTTMQQVVTITATASGFTPTSYTFIFPTTYRYFDGTRFRVGTRYNSVTQAGNTYAWTVECVDETYTVYVLATDGADEAWNSTTGTMVDTDADAFMTATGIPNDATVYFNATAYQCTGADLWDRVLFLTLAMKFSGLWTICDAIYPIVGGTSTTHKFNLKNPADLDAAFRLSFSGGWTHDGAGMKGNGTTGYADTFLAPSTFTNYDCHLSYSCNFSDATLATYDMGCAASFGTGDKQTAMFFRRSGDTAAFDYFTDATFATRALSNNVTTSVGFYIGNVKSSSDRNLYKGMSKIARQSTTYATLGNATQSIFINAGNNGGSAAFYSNRRAKFITIGDGLTDDLHIWLVCIENEFNFRNNR